jgi:orotidine-5'-phosphate decarboxylase
MKEGKGETDRSEHCMIVAEAHAAKMSPNLCIYLVGSASSHKQEISQDKLRKPLTEVVLRAVNQHRNAALLTGVCGHRHLR